MRDATRRGIGGLTAAHAAAVTVRSVQNETAHEPRHGGPSPTEHADLAAALMNAYLSGNGAEVERVMALMAEADSAGTPRAAA